MNTLVRVVLSVATALLTPFTVASLQQMNNDRGSPAEKGGQPGHGAHAMTTE